MSDPVTTPPEEVPKFDVIVRLPANRRVEDIPRMAEAAGIRPDHVDVIVKSLRNGPSVKIGAAVTRERADRAREQFTRAGLNVDITPVLALQSMVTGAFDSLFSCPNCGKRVQLPENRQCPACSVFVDKVTEEMILRRKLREKEKAALDFRTARDQQNAEKATREALEAQIRDEIRQELEAEMGIKRGGAGGVRKGIVIAGAAALAVAAFIGGRGSSAGWTMAGLMGGESKAAEAPAAKAGQMLDKLDAGAAAGGDTAAAAAAHGGPATGDPDIDDPLVQAAGGKRIGAKGISIEQAVGAAQTLAKSVGYKSVGTDAATSGGAVPAAAPGATSGGAAPASGAPPTADGGAAASAPIPPKMRTLLAIDFTRLLAELGQLPRSREMLKALRAVPANANDPALATAAAAADIELRAWSLGSTRAGGLRAAAEDLIKAAQALPDAATRSKALMQAGVIAARQPRLPPETARLFLNQAAEALKGVEGPQQAAALGDWTVALGEVVLHEAIAHAKVGQWNKVRASSGQVEAMIAQAPDASAAARLHAIDHQLKLLTNQTDKATQTLTVGLAAAGREPGLVERAALLRQITMLSGIAPDGALAAAIEQVKVAAATRNGYERARTMTWLALLHADSGLRARAGEYTQLALSTPQLAGPEASELHADLLLRGDMVTAKSLHGAGLYADSEAMLRRLGELLL